MDVLAQRLRLLEQQGRARALTLPAGIDFTSNDYLGFSRHPALRQAALDALDSGIAIGAGGSRLLSGHGPEHAAAEEGAALFFGCERTLFFGSGYQANTALLSTLPDRHDVILYDALIHASLRDGLRAAPARAVKIPHNDLQALESAVARFAGKEGRVYIVVESVYSMDGDCADIPACLDMAQRHGATLIVDEAHATGIFGARGRGFTEGMEHNEHLIAVHTCGKALGVAGGLICAAPVVIDTLINRARGFIYSTAPMPLQAHLVRHALKLVDMEPQRRESLLALRDYASKTLPVKPSPSQIIPVILGDDRAAVDAAALCREAGFDIRAIRPPTVPEGTARLRVSLNTDIAQNDIDRLSALLRSLPAIKAAA